MRTFPVGLGPDRWMGAWTSADHLAHHLGVFQAGFAKHDCCDTSAKFASSPQICSISAAVRLATVLRLLYYPDCETMPATLLNLSWTRKGPSHHVLFHSHNDQLSQY
jgi:hypothetical protein